MAERSQPTLHLGDRALRLVRLVGSERVSAPFSYAVETVAFAGSCPLRAGASARIELLGPSGEARTIHGIVASFSTRQHDADTTVFKVELRPASHSLTTGRASRTFQDLSAIEAIESVLGRRGVPFRLALRQQYGKVPYRVQRAESDWDFVVRTAGELGIAYFYDHDAGSSLVFCDDTSVVGNRLELPLLLDAALGEERPRISSFASIGRVTAGAFASRGQSWEKPGLDLANRSGGGRYESYQPEARSVADPAGQAARTAGASGRARARASGASGTTSSVRVVPGLTLVTDDETGSRTAVFITSIDVRHDHDGRELEIVFAGIDGGSHAAPALAAKRSAAHVGLSLGRVVAADGDPVYPDEHGRVRVQMHWDREGAFDATSGTWGRVAQRGAPGSMMLPRKGWRVYLVAEEGNGDAPLVLSRIADGENPPSYPLPENMTRVVYKTPSLPEDGTTSELHFEDARGREVFYLHAARDLEILTKRVAGERVRRDALHDVGRDQKVDVAHRWTEEVHRDRDVSIGGDRTTRIDGTRQTSVEGAYDRTIAGSRTLRVGASHSTSAGTREVRVGALQLDVSLGAVDSSSDVGLTMVGGVGVRLSGGASTTDTGGIGIETTGGVKLESAATSKVLDVARSFTETVGVAATLRAGLQVTMNATTTSALTVGGALDSETEELLVEAGESITLVCGQSFIRILPEEIELGSTVIALEAGILDLSTTTIEHNT